MTNTESFGRGRIADTISASASVPFTLNVSKVPNNDNQFITINPDTNNEEIFFYTTRTGTAGGVGTINVTGRGYKPFGVATPDVAYQKEHDENVEFKISLNHMIINDKADIKTVNTFEKDQTFEGDILFTTADNLGLKLNSLTTTERDAITPANGYLIYNETDNVIQQYIGGAWNNVGNTGTPDASETVAGKVEVATDAELAAGTDIGGTGAQLVVKPSQIYNATTTTKGIVEQATNAEVVTGTDDVRYVTPKGIRDNYQDNYISSDTASIGPSSSHVFTVPSNCNVILSTSGLNGSFLGDVTLTRAGRTSGASWTSGSLSFNTGANQLTWTSGSGSGTWSCTVYYYITL